MATHRIAPRRFRGCFGRASTIVGAVIAMTLLGCSAPAYFTFRSTVLHENSGAQAQLGNLGIVGGVGGTGFQRGAFLSECSAGVIPVAVDARMPHLAAVQTAFAGQPSLDEIGKGMGYTREELERMSVVLLSVSPIDVMERLKLEISPRCKDYIEKNAVEVRIVTSVALALDFPILRETDVNLDVQSVLGPRGSVGLAATVRKSKKVNVNPGHVFAFRQAHFCWKEEDGSDLILRADDPAFAECPAGYVTSPPEGWTWDAMMTGGSEEEGGEGEPDKEAPPPAKDTPKTPA